MIKVLVFVLCVLGFAYQTIDFLNLYLSYPTSVNVHVSTPSEILPPALTVCNRNRRRRSALCERQPKMCSKVINICQFIPRVCVDGKEPYNQMVFPQELLLYRILYWSDAIEEAHLENIRSCNITTDKGNFTCGRQENIPYVDFKGEPTYCQVVRSLMDMPDEELVYYPNTFTYEMELDTKPEEYLKSTEPVRLQVAVHDRRYLLNPFVDGKKLEGGTQYICHVSMTETRRLPDPYDTHCFDYLVSWKKNNGSGALNQQSCIEICKMEMGLQSKYECVDKHVSYPHESPLCQKSIVTSTAEVIKNCTDSCPKACLDRSYQVVFEEVKDLAESCDINKGENCKVKYIKIIVSFKSFQVTNYIYEPKFESIELYSYVGGFMGMWLGLSLVSLFDLVETVFKLVAYPFNRMLAKKRRKKVKPRILGYY